jgi:hypothetical protein
MLLQLIDAARDVLDTALRNLLGDLFLIEDDDFLNRASAALQIVANGQNLVDHNGRARKCFQGGELSPLDTLGNVHLPFAREQRRGAHLPQVNAHRIAGRFRSAWSQVKLDLLCFLGKLLLETRPRYPRIAFEHVKAPRANGDKQIAHILRGMHVVRNQTIQLVVSGH